MHPHIYLGPLYAIARLLPSLNLFSGSVFN